MKRARPISPLEAYRAAQGTEARRAETVKQGSVHDGPVGETDAPNLSHLSIQEGTNNGK